MAIEIDMKRWAKRDDLKDALRETLRRPEMEAAISLLQLDGKPSTNIKGLSSEYMNNVALTHAFQAGVHHVLDKLKTLPNIAISEQEDMGRSWQHKEDEVLEESKKNNIQP